MNRASLTSIWLVLCAILSALPVSAQTVGKIAVIESSASAGVPVHPAPGDLHYSRWANGSIVTVTAVDSATGWYQVSRGTSSGWVLLMYIRVLQPPKISGIPNLQVEEGATLGPISFTVADPDTTLTLLTLKAASSNETLVPSGRITFGGSGGKRTLTLAPATNQFGTTTITVTVSDGIQSASDQFTVLVTRRKTPLRLSTPEISDGGQIHFRIHDGVAGDTAVLETSTDFAEWDAIQTNTVPATACATCPFVEITIEPGGTGPRFYRALNR